MSKRGYQGVSGDQLWGDQKIKLRKKYGYNVKIGVPGVPGYRVTRKSNSEMVNKKS